MDRELKSFIKDGVEYYQLFGPCPRCCELGHYNCTTPVMWVCEKCRGDIYVGNNAHLYCPECENDFKMIFAHFSCPNCSQDGCENIIKFDRRIPHNYPSLGAICLYRGSPLWIKTFLEELRKQP